MREITTIGLDLAKRTFHVIGCDANGKEVKRKMLKRAKVLAYFANLPACVVGMEACASAHFWGRALQGLGHEVRLIPPQHVKAYVRGNKNDYNDAGTIAEAARRPDMRLVAVKIVEQQDAQALHRLRETRVAERTALCNQIRGFLAEYGIALTHGVSVLRKRLPELLEDADNGLSDFFRPLLADCYQQLQEIDAHIDFYTQALRRHAKHNEAIRRLQKKVPGLLPRTFGTNRDEYSTLEADLGDQPWRRQVTTKGRRIRPGGGRFGGHHLWLWTLRARVSRTTVRVGRTPGRNYAAARAPTRSSDPTQHTLHDSALFAVSRAARARVLAASSLYGTSFPRP